ncbi:unnamed protein product, partial [Sphagnum tenellum]
ICEINPDNQGRICSYLTLIQDEVASNSSVISEEDKNKLGDGLEHFDCLNFMNSTPSANIPTSKPERRKRQAAPPPPAKDVPRVDGDCDATAKFLQKYLQLDPQIRRNIGHRLWLQLSNPSYGNCYLFNYMHNKDDEEAPRMASLTGLSNGENPFNTEKLHAVKAVKLEYYELVIIIHGSRSDSRAVPGPGQLHAHEAVQEGGGQDRGAQPRPAASARRVRAGSRAKHGRGPSR